MKIIRNGMVLVTIFSMNIRNPVDSEACCEIV